MKKGWKTFWIVCGTLLGVGIVLCITGFMLGASRDVILGGIPDWINLREIRNDTIETEYEYGETAGEVENGTSFKNVNKIEVEAKALNLQILTDEELIDEVRVEVSDEVFATKINLRRVDEVLRIETNRKFKLGHETGTIWIYIPVTRFEEVEIDVDAGSIYVEEVTAGTFSVSMGAGEAVIDKFSAEEVDFECGAGRIEASGDCGRELDGTCGTGEIIVALAGKEDEYDYEVECGIGEVTVGENVYSGIGNQGHHSHGSHGSYKKMNIECGIGTIEVSFYK